MRAYGFCFVLYLQVRATIESYVASDDRIVPQTLAQDCHGRQYQCVLYLDLLVAFRSSIDAKLTTCMDVAVKSREFQWVPPHGHSTKKLPSTRSNSEVVGRSACGQYGTSRITS